MKQNFKFNLTLTIEELINFFAISYASSLANPANAQGAKEAYSQLALESERVIIEIDPNKVELISKVKNSIKDNIDKMNKLS
ncbi:MAG: hypothetical protein ACOYNN_15440 [Terrimicrobiaceae bacterium]